MLEYLRNMSEKLIAKILIGILAFSFVGWGVAEWIFGNVMGDSTLVTVGDADIDAQHFGVEKSRQMAAMSREQQRAVYADDATQRDFNNQVLTTLTTRQMVENRADDLGFVVSDKRIAREIREFPEFQVNGEFSTFAFDNVLARSGYSEAQFAELLRNEVLRSMILGSMSVPMKTPRFALDAAYRTRYATRSVEYATVKFSDFAVGDPTIEQLRAFYAQNPQVIPEKRSVSYVLISTNMSQPDSYEDGLARAQRVEDEIISGEEFAVAAKKHSAKYVNLGKFSADKRPADTILTDAMVARVFDMEPGIESELIETKQGFVIIRVDEIVPSHNAAFDDVKSALVSDWRRAEQKKQAYARANEILVDLNRDGALKNKKSATVSRASGAPTDVLAAAFNNSVNTNTLVPGDDAFYVLHVGGETAPQVDAKKRDALQTELQNMNTRAIIDDYNSFLMREYPVKINKKVYNKFFAK